ncbi:MAG: hypothetical protein ACK4QL_04885 [Pseudanabaenaceae cyanobacterium]
MGVHYCQHAPFENLDCIQRWVEQKHYQLTGTMLFAGKTCPVQQNLTG